MTEDKKVELEKLNTLLDTTSASLYEALGCDLSPEEITDRYARTKRLQGELDRTLEALGVDIPETHMVRVKNEDGEDEQHEVTFPIYSKGIGREYRRVDSDMTEVILMFVEPVDACVHNVYGIMTRSSVTFLGDLGSDYYLGKGDFAIDGSDFENALETISHEISVAEMAVD